MNNYKNIDSHNTYQIKLINLTSSFNLSGYENKYIINKSSYLEKKQTNRRQYYSMNLLFIYYIKNITTKNFFKCIINDF